MGEFQKELSPRQDSVLQFRELSFRLLVESVRDYGIYMLDPLGRILTWNLGAERITGYSSAEVLGRHFSLFYDEQDRGRRHPDVELEIADKEGRYEEEGWRVRKDGARFWASVVITRLEDGRGGTIGFAKVTRDLSERRKAEQEIRAANESLERRVQERTEALIRLNRDLREAIRARDEFLSIASHELRTPLTPLKIQVQLLKRGLLSEEGNLERDKVVRAADTIDRSLHRIEKLIENLLDVARINAGRLQFHPEAVDVVEIVHDVVARHRPEAQRAGSEIRLQAPASIPAVLDRLRFEQILVNLLSNAIKYGRGAPIDVEIGIDGEELCLLVRDRGVGLREEDLDRIFQRFERVANGLETGGLGLGLFIARQIADALGGVIRAEGSPGKGARFTVRLPHWSGANPS